MFIDLKCEVIVRLVDIGKMFDHQFHPLNFLFLIHVKYGSWIYNYLYTYMQSLPITTDVVSSNLDQGEVYNIMW